MTREERFEKMLADVQTEYAQLTQKLEQLRLENKTKTATYRELLGRKMLCAEVLSRYRQYGLLE
ncbi:MAG: hypothetical protein MJ118_07975 [Clostridia bacterium]|nr:hypothetical protein [Clostridia bacterium]